MHQGRVLLWVGPDGHVVHPRGAIQLPDVSAKGIQVQQEWAGQSESKLHTYLVLASYSVLYTCDIDTGGSDDGSCQQTLPCTGSKDININ